MAGWPGRLSRLFYAVHPSFFGGGRSAGYARKEYVGEGALPLFLSASRRLFQSGLFFSPGSRSAGYVRKEYVEKGALPLGKRKLQAGMAVLPISEQAAAPEGGRGLRRPEAWLRLFVQIVGDRSGDLLHLFRGEGELFAVEVHVLRAVER